MRLAARWRDAGHTLHLVLGRDEGMPPGLADGLAFDILQKPGMPSTSAFETAWMIARLPGRIRAFRPDLIFCPGNSYAVVGAAMKLMLGGDCPPVALKISNDLARDDMPGAVRPFYRLWCRLQGSLLDGFVALADPMRREIQAAMNVGRDRVAVINNPVLSRSDIETLRQARMAVDRSHRGRRFLAIGRLTPQKNFTLLIRAFARIARPDDQLVILGEGPKRAALQRLTRRIGLEGRVLLPGHTEMTAGWLAGADAFVLSSEYEGLPAVVAEAMATGLPVIATRCCVSIPALIESERIGRLVPVGDEIALAAAMATPFVTDPGRAAEIADRFTIEQAAPAYLALFEDMIAQREELRWLAARGVS